MLVDDTKILYNTHCKERFQISEAIIIQKKQLILSKISFSAEDGVL